MPTIAWRAKPSCRGSVTATTCMTPLSVEPLHALAHGGLGQPDHLADGGVRATAVLLELLDDRLRDVVEVGTSAACGRRGCMGGRGSGHECGLHRPRVASPSPPGNEDTRTGQGIPSLVVTRPTGSLVVDRWSDTIRTDVRAYPGARHAGRGLMPDFAEPTRQPRLGRRTLMRGAGSGRLRSRQHRRAAAVRHRRRGRRTRPRASPRTCRRPTRS